MLGRVQKDITQISIDVCLTSSDKSFHTYAGHEQVMIYLENYTAMKEPTGSTTFDFYWERLYSAFCNGYNASSFFQIYDVVFNMQCTWFSPNTVTNIKTFFSNESGMECTWLSPNTLTNIKTFFSNESGSNGVHMAHSKHVDQYQNNFQEWSAHGSLQTGLQISKQFSVMSEEWRNHCKDV